MFRFNLTPIVKNLIIINVLVYLVQIGLVQQNKAYGNYFVLAKTDAFGIQDALYGTDRPVATTHGTIGLSLEEYNNALGLEFQPYQLVLSFFSHSTGWFFHLLMNMLALAFIGPQVERVIGPKRFLSAYLIAGFLGSIFVTLFDPSMNPVVGASGAVSGVLLLFAMIYPDARMIIFPIPIPIKAKWLVTGLIVISTGLVLNEMREPGSGGGISHFGHLMGMLAVFLYLQAVRLYYRFKQ